MIKIGSVFSGIGGFELGLERAIPNSQTIWQCEKDKYCRRILQKHWPDAKMYDDITKMDTAEVERPHILCGGFPCQDISVAGKGAGIHGKKSGLWWHMHALISRFRPSIIVLENVPAISFRGAKEVLGSLAQIGYDAEWTIISARQFGAPHIRKRWFCVAYPHKNTDKIKGTNTKSYPIGQKKSTALYKKNRERQENIRKENIYDKRCDSVQNQSAHSHSKRKPDSPKYETSMERLSSYSISKRSKKHPICRQQPVEKKGLIEYRSSQTARIQPRNYWKGGTSESPLCAVDDGIPQRVARLKALGNAIVPQCSEYIGHCIVRSGLLETIV